MIHDRITTPHPARRADDPAPRNGSRRKRGWIMAGVATATALTAAALFNRATARRAETTFPPIGSFVEVDGVRLHYVDVGEGPVVLMLHGNGFMLQDFMASGVLERTALRHRVIAFDRPGFGYSGRPRSTVWTPATQAALFAHALRQLGIAQATVVGHSWGAMVALALALDDPDIVTGLVLISGYYYGTARPDVLPFSVSAIPGVGDVMTHTVAPLSGRVTIPAGLAVGFAPAPVSPDVARIPLPLMLRASQIRASAAEAALMVPAAVALGRRYGELLMPVRIVAGEGDLIAYADTHARRLAADIPGSGLRIVPGQGHFVHYAQPDMIVTAIGEVEAQAAAG